MEKPQQVRLRADVLKPLTVKTNVAAALHTLGHLGAIALAAAALWYSLDSWLSVPVTALLGYLLAFLFTAEHEMAHRTAFKTRELNDVVGHFAGFAILLPFEYYRVYHWDHHRFTQNPEKDPELSFALPGSKAGLLWYWSGLPFWWSRIRLLFMHALLGRVTAPWIPDAKRGDIIREARYYLLGYIVIVGASAMLQSLALLWLWLVPVMAGQLFLRPYLMAEHTGCLHSENMLENTRTTYTNWVVRFFAWNMPFHSEHHSYPAVPFHALPKLNALLAPHLVNAENGYPAATVAATRYIVGAMPAAIRKDAGS
jgi:fatty acid desaturase